MFQAEKKHNARPTIACVKYILFFRSLSLSRAFIMPLYEIAEPTGAGTATTTTTTTTTLLLCPYLSIES